MSQVAGRAPAQPQRPGMPQQPGQSGPQDPMQARKMIQVRKMMLQSELLKIKAMEAMMPQPPKQGKKSPGV
jgi:hypothetical protein